MGQRRGRSGLEGAVGDGGAVGVALEGVGGDGAEEVFDEHLVGEEADDFVVAVEDEEEKAVGAEKSGESLGERVVGTEVVEGGVDEISGAGCGFGVEVVEGGGMDDADEVAGGIADGKMLEAGAIEAVEYERAEGGVGINIGDIGVWEHEIGDSLVGEVDGGDDVLAFEVGENGIGGAAE